MKKYNIIKTCIALNMTQIFLSCMCAVLGNLGILNDIIVKTALFSLQTALWILVTMYMFVKLDIKGKTKGFKAGFMAVIPALLLTVSAFLMGDFADSNAASWLPFAFLGSSILFFNKPALILASYIKIADAYLIFLVNYLWLILAATTGGFLGASSNIKTVKKAEARKQAQKEEQISVTMLLDNLEEAENEIEGEGVIKIQEDADLSNVILDETYEESPFDEATVVAEISIPAEDEQNIDEDEGEYVAEVKEEEIIHEVVSIISVDLEELEDEAEDSFKKRYDEEMPSEEKIISEDMECKSHDETGHEGIEEKTEDRT